MRKSTRAALAVSLGLVGVAGIVVPSIGQDRQVVQAKDGGQAAAPKNAGPAVIGTINMEAVFKGCDKFLAMEEQIENDAKVRQAELMKIANEGNAETEKLKKLAPGTPTTKTIEDNITSLQARFEAGRKQAQMEIARKHGELMAKTVNEVRQMAQAVATQQRGMTLVLQASTTEASIAQPDTIEMALSRAVVYSDPRFDITADVIKYLNYWNEKNGGPKPTRNHNPSTPGAPAAPAAAVAPAGDTRSR